MSFITAYSFTFNGINSHEYNVDIGWIGSSEPDTSTNGLNREIKQTANLNRIQSHTYGTENTNSITFNFSIFKPNGEEITRTESIKINQWLTSSPLPQKLIFNDSDPYPLHYYAICTQIKDVIAGGKLVGKELTFETNSPYAFMQKSEKSIEVDICRDELTGYPIISTKIFSLNNPSDTYNGIYYPTITILTKSVNIVIENITDKKSVTLDTTAVTPDNAGNKIIRLNSEKMTVLDKDNKLIPADQLGWNYTYKSYVSSIDDYMDNIYWVRLLKGINQFKVTSDNSCTLKIECEYPRKAGCL